MKNSNSPNSWLSRWTAAAPASSHGLGLFLPLSVYLPAYLPPSYPLSTHAPIHPSFSQCINYYFQNNDKKKKNCDGSLFLCLTLGGISLSWYTPCPLDPHHIKKMSCALSLSKYVVHVCWLQTSQVVTCEPSVWLSCYSFILNYILSLK